MFFHSNMAWYPATYDVISRNRRNWPSLNFSQNAREEQTNNYWKRQVLMFYPLGKNSKNLKRRRGGWQPSAPLYVRGLTWQFFFFEQISQGKEFDEVLYRKESHSKLENIDL